MPNKDINVVTVTDFDETQFDVTNADQSNKIRLKPTSTTEIPISQEIGNMLTRKEDGLYVGIKHKKVYIANEGVDDPSRGDKSTPYRTIDYALLQNENVTELDVFLKEQQTHYIEVSPYSIRNDKNLTFNAYSADNEKQSNWMKHTNSQNQPVLKFKEHLGDTVLNKGKFFCFSGGFLTFRAITFDLGLDNGARKLAFFSGTNGNIGLNGCTVRLTKNEKEKTVFLFVAPFPLIINDTNVYFDDRRSNKQPVTLGFITGSFTYNVLETSANTVGAKELLQNKLRNSSRNNPWISGIVRDKTARAINVISNIPL